MASRNRYYSGPASDHFDGTRFFVPGGAAPDKTARDLWRLWRTTSPPWPECVDNPPAAPVLPRVDRGLRVTAIGHATHLIQTQGLTLLFDPVWSERASPFASRGPKRVRPPGLPLEALPPIDAILITHNHYDHLDLATLERLAGRGSSRIVVPLGNDGIIRRRIPGARIEAYDWENRVDLGSQVRATLVPAYHWSSRWLNDRRMALWAAYVIETATGPIYYVGDTGYGDGAIFREVRRQYGSPWLAVLPIGAYAPRWFMRDQHVDPHEAVKIFLDCGARYAVAHHWGCFKLTTEPIDEPPRQLALALDEAGLPQDRFRVLRPGEAFDVPEI